MECFNCGEIGHLDANCPLRFQAESWRGHLKRVERLVDLWVEGRITREQKRRMISAENVLWYGADNPELRVHRLIYP